MYREAFCFTTTASPILIGTLQRIAKWSLECGELHCFVSLAPLPSTALFRANRDGSNLISCHRSSFVTLHSAASRDTRKGLCKPPSTHLVILVQFNPLHGMQRNTAATRAWQTTESTSARLSARPWVCVFYLANGIGACKYLRNCHLRTTLPKPRCE